MTLKVAPNGSKEIAVSSKIAIFTEGTATIYYRQIAGATPAIYYKQTTVSNQQTTLTPGSTVDYVRIDAGPEFEVLYAVGASPTITTKSVNNIQGAADPVALQGKAAASAAGSNGGDVDVTGAAATAGTSTTAGGIGGDADLTAGAGGAKTDTGAAAGGAGGAATVTSGAGGATASAGSDAGGAAGAVNITAGAGGNASAGTGNGGQGGDIIQTPGTGGTSSGGSAGANGAIIQRGTVLKKQAAPAAKTTTATLTAAELIGGLLTANQGASGSATYTTPTGTQLDAALPQATTNDSFDFSIVNISTDAAEDVTLAAGTGVTLVGNMVVASNNAATDKSVGTFRARKTGSATWSVYRIAG